MEEGEWRHYTFGLSIRDVAGNEGSALSYSFTVGRWGVWSCWLSVSVFILSVGGVCGVEVGCESI